jgi:hypothetical protein
MLKTLRQCKSRATQPIHITGQTDAVIAWTNSTRSTLPTFTPIRPNSRPTHLVSIVRID